MERTMSLNKEHKDKLNKSCLVLLKIIRELQDVPLDPRVLDLFEIAGSLIEQQIEMNIVFEVLDSDDMDDDVIFFAESEDEQDELLNKVVHVKFDNENEDTPSKEELEEWFELEE